MLFNSNNYKGNIRPLSSTVHLPEWLPVKKRVPAGYSKKIPPHLSGLGSEGGDGLDKRANVTGASDDCPSHAQGCESLRIRATSSTGLFLDNLVDFLQSTGQVLGLSSAGLSHVGPPAAASTDHTCQLFDDVAGMIVLDQILADQGDQ